MNFTFRRNNPTKTNDSNKNSFFKSIKKKKTNFGKGFSRIGSLVPSGPSDE
jgi:hypothetical protein